MTSIVKDITWVEPLCPHKTSDVVRLLREVIASLESAGIVQAGDETLVEYAAREFGRALEGIDPSTALLMVQQAEVTDPLVVKVRPVCKVRLRFVPCGEAFNSVADAMKKTIRRHIGSDQSSLDELDITLLASLVLTNTDDSRGQLSHPIQLRKEIERVAQACRSIRSEHHVQFLEALQTACLNAHRAGAVVAAVAIRDRVTRDEATLEFEPFYCDSEEMFGVEAASRRGSATCVHLLVVQQEGPV